MAVLHVSSHGQNLIPNPSFEEYDTCPDLSFDGQLIHAVPWFQPNTYYGIGGSTDYFNACFDHENGYGMPSNIMGYQLAHTGNAYAGFSPFVCYDCNGREYLEVELNQPLVQGVQYYVSFYVSVAKEHGTFAIDRIGAYFSIDVLQYNSIDALPINVVPQIQNPPGNSVVEDSAWQSISGLYVALGGEKFITIGNFYNDDETTVDTLFPLGPNENGAAYYYIDDVMVIPDSLNSILDIQTSVFQIYPNPNDGEFTFECLLGANSTGTLKISDATGRVLESWPIGQSSTTIRLHGFPSGVYLYHFFSGDEKPLVARLILIRP